MIDFNEENHTYTRNGKQLISTTQLMRLMGLAPDYSNVSKSVLEARAGFGTLVHKEVEDYCQKGMLGLTDEFYAFKEWKENNHITTLGNEVVVADDNIAGTIDLFYEKNGEYYISDIKTTSSVHKEAVSWQLSIYKYLYQIFYKGMAEYFDFTKASCLWLHNGELKEVEINFKKQSEVEKLIACYLTGMPYRQELSEASSELANLYEVSTNIAKYENTLKILKAQQEEYKAKILGIMEKNGMTKYEDDEITITYKAPYQKSSFDSKSFKVENPELYKQYEKTSIVSGSVLIKVKEIE